MKPEHRAIMNPLYNGVEDLREFMRTAQPQDMLNWPGCKQQLYYSDDPARWKSEGTVYYTFNVFNDEAGDPSMIRTISMGAAFVADLYGVAVEAVGIYSMEFFDPGVSVKYAICEISEEWGSEDIALTFYEEELTIIHPSEDSQGLGRWMLHDITGHCAPEAVHERHPGRTR